MSKHTYAGSFRNPTTEWRVSTEQPNGKYIIEVKFEEEIEHDGVTGIFVGWRPHTSAWEFDWHEDAVEHLEVLEQAYEEDYDEYLEENRHEIAQMERYEMWRNEF